jgi:acetyl-CoA carboxylase carboxyltransferase component
MGPAQAVGIVHRRRIAEDVDPGAERDRLAVEYADEHLTAAAAARQGFIDEIVVPSQSRARLADALSALETGTPTSPHYSNIPL